MTAFFYGNISPHWLKNFKAVRDSFDNLENILQIAEIINNNTHCRLTAYQPNFDVAIFTGNFSRVLIKKPDGYISMAMPFQILDFDQQIAFNIDFYDQNVEGYFISLMRNAIKSTRNKQISFDDIVFSLHQDFELPIDSSIRYANIFIHLMSEDHGYFRFDDDPANQNGDYHPRYHFDFFCKNSTAVKIGTDMHVDIDCFYSLFDNTHTKHYLRR